MATAYEDGKNPSLVSVNASGEMSMKQVSTKFFTNIALFLWL